MGDLVIGVDDVYGMDVYEFMVVQHEDATSRVKIRSKIQQGNEIWGGITLVHCEAGD